MKRRLELLDTSILVEILRVPGEYDNIEDILTTFERKRKEGVTFQLPAATIVETGAHVVRVKDGSSRRDCAERFERILKQTFQGEAPWSFTDLVWDRQFVGELLNPPESYQELGASLATKTLEMGDLVILAELRRVRATLDLSYIDVDIWTQDGGLRAAADRLRS